ncbi:hypothetical protein QSG27_28820 [Azospirillum sp. C340-1]|uniref:Uncharacterized protein n=1 Tax=Azospirillum isscasi TaxID=3053926 RepID=A0ABU0WRA5_9PROT|nr:hypothetical protein [Azospirillum isscasi]
MEVLVNHRLVARGGSNRQ